MFIEGNFLGGHPSTEEAYMITGSINGHWPMNDDPFNRRYSTMRQDGYFWRPAYIPPVSYTHLTLPTTNSV